LEVKSEMTCDAQNEPKSDQKRPKAKGASAPTQILIRSNPRLKQEAVIPADVDVKALQIWSWNINGIRAILKKNRL